MVLVKMLAALALLAAPAMVAAQSPALDAAIAAMEDYDDPGARAALNEGCDAGDTAACRMLLAMLSTNYDENDDATARALAGKMCEGGEMLGCVTLARFAEVGRGGDADHELQRNSIFTACRAGHAGACLQATYLAQQDNDGMGDEALGREMSGKGCAAGNGQACAMVGSYLQNRGWNAESDVQREGAFEQSRRAFRRGCDLGDRDSCTSLAGMLLDGTGGEVDKPGGIALLETQCVQDYYVCEILLGALRP